jgi:hypothetical protein
MCATNRGPLATVRRTQPMPRLGPSGCLPALGAGLPAGLQLSVERVVRDLPAALRRSGEVVSDGGTEAACPVGLGIALSAILVLGATFSTLAVVFTLWSSASHALGDLFGRPSSFSRELKPFHGEFSSVGVQAGQ